MLGLQLIKNLFNSMKTTIMGQLTKNSRNLINFQKKSNADITNIHKSFTNEKTLVKNKMAEIKDKSSKEYEDLLMEYNELKDIEDNQCTKVENDSSDYEQVINVENDSLQNRLNAITEDEKAADETQKERIKEQFGYFQ